MNNALSKRLILPLFLVLIACGGGSGSGPQDGCDLNIIAHDLTTGACIDVISQRKGYDYAKSGTHISALVHRNPGWIAASMVGFQEDGQA